MDDFITLMTRGIRSQLNGATGTSAADAVWTTIPSSRIEFNRPLYELYSQLRICNEYSRPYLCLRNYVLKAIYRS